MARNAKNTVTVKIGEVEQEFTPQLQFNMETVNPNQFAYLVQLGLKQRIGAATRAKVAQMTPEVEKNLKLKEEMSAFGMPQEMVDKFFSGRQLTVDSTVELELSDIFPAKLDAEEEEETPTPATETKKNGNGKGRK